MSFDPCFFFLPIGRPFRRCSGAAPSAHMPPQPSPAAACFSVDQLAGFLLVPANSFVLVGVCISISKAFTTHADAFAKRCRVIKIKSLTSSTFTNCLLTVSDKNAVTFAHEARTFFRASAVEVHVFRVLPKSPLAVGGVLLVASHIRPLAKTLFEMAPAFSEAYSTSKRCFGSVETANCVNYEGCITDDRWSALGIVELDEEVLFVAHPFSDAFCAGRFMLGSLVEIFFAHSVGLQVAGGRWRRLLYGCVCTSLFVATFAEEDVKVGHKTHMRLDAHVADALAAGVSVEGLVSCLSLFLALRNGDSAKGDVQKMRFFFDVARRKSQMSQSATWLPLGQALEDALEHANCIVPLPKSISLKGAVTFADVRLAKFVLPGGLLIGRLKRDAAACSLISVDKSATCAVAFEGPFVFVPFGGGDDDDDEGIFIVAFEWTLLTNAVTLQTVLSVSHFVASPAVRRRCFDGDCGVEWLRVVASSPILVPRFSDEAFLLLEVERSAGSRVSLRVGGECLRHWLLWPSLCVTRISVESALFFAQDASVGQSSSSSPPPPFSRSDAVSLCDAAFLVDIEAHAAAADRPKQPLGLCEVCTEFRLLPADVASQTAPLPDVFGRVLIGHSFCAEVVAVFRPRRHSSKITAKLKDLTCDFVFDLMIDVSFFHVPATFAINSVVTCSHLLATTNTHSKHAFFEVCQFSTLQVSSPLYVSAAFEPCVKSAEGRLDRVSLPFNFRRFVLLTFLRFRKVDFDSRPIGNVIPDSRVKAPFFSASLCATDGTRNVLVYFYDLAVFLRTFPTLKALFAAHAIVRVNFTRPTQLQAAGVVFEQQFLAAIKHRYFHCCTVQVADDVAHNEIMTGNVSKLLCIERLELNTLEMLKVFT